MYEREEYLGRKVEKNGQREKGDEIEKWSEKAGTQKKLKR